MQLHHSAAATADKFSAKDVLGFGQVIILSYISLCSGRRFTIDPLYFFKQRTVDDRFVRSVCHNPFFSGCCVIRNTCIETLTDFSLFQIPEIDRILKNFCNHMFVPQNPPIFLIIVRLDPPFQSILSRRRNVCRVKPFANTHITDAFRAPQVDLPNDRRGISANNQLIFVIGRLSIAMRRVVGNEFTTLHFRTK